MQESDPDVIVDAGPDFSASGPKKLTRSMIEARVHMSQSAVSYLYISLCACTRYSIELLC